MAISLTIPIERLRSPGVSKALSELVLALGDHVPGPVSTESRPTQPRPSRRPRAAAAAPSAEPERFKAFVAGLPDTSRRFLQVLEERKTLTISQAMKALDLDRAKSLGGITGSISRWAPQREIAVPFESGKTKRGERFWRWTRGGPESGTKN